jgi:cell division protein ZapA (FtsZ GTPase activity inhibitor)
MTEKIEITLLGKPLQVAAQNEAEVRSLQTAARALDARLQHIRAHNQTLPNERLLITAALNLMHELLTLESEQHAIEQVVKRSLNQVRELEEV